MIDPPETPASAGLAASRAALDEIDDTILDLLGRRMEVVRALAASRAKPGPFYRPGREAALLRRLLARAGDVPPTAVRRVWREIVAASREVQGPFAAVAAPGTEALARAHFGEAAFDSTSGVPSVTVLPRAAWRTLLERRELSVVAVLPVLSPEWSALVVATQPPDPSGDDRTLSAHPGEEWSLVDRPGFLSKPPEVGALVLGAYAAPPGPP